MLNFELHIPTKLLFGQGELKKLPSELALYGKNVLLLTGGSSVKKMGLFEEVLALLPETTFCVHKLEGVQPNPRITVVREGVRLCKEKGIEVVLAVGGGSVLDAAKAIAAGAKYEGDPWDFYLGTAKVEDALPLVTVLTLAATGTEMNGNSVISNEQTEQKLACYSPFSFPKVSILDPTYTFSVPPDQTAYGIVDIMAHVFEQYFTPTKEIPLHERIAEGVLQTVIENARRVLENPRDYHARATILWCGTMALNTLLSQGVVTDWASHKMEHELSAIYDIPHGGGLAVVFPGWMRYVWKEEPRIFKQYALRVWGVDSKGKEEEEIILEGIQKTEDFFASLGIPTHLRGYGIDETRIPEMAEKATEKGSLGAVKKLTKQDVEAILFSVLDERIPS